MGKKANKNKQKALARNVRANSSRELGANSASNSAANSDAEDEVAVAVTAATKIDEVKIDVAPTLPVVPESPASPAPASPAPTSPPSPPKPPTPPKPTPEPTSIIEHSLHLLSLQETQLANDLIADGQTHLFSHWTVNVDDDKKKSQMMELMKLHASYPLPNGLLSYVENARTLLKVSKEGKNPLEGWTPSLPKGETLSLNTREYATFQNSGTPLIKSTAFVLVAGGLGERLGYSGIKIGLPIGLVDGMCYLEYYCLMILGLQSKHGDADTVLPLVIMVSDDTHLKTLKLLEDNNYYGMDMAAGQVTLVKQEKVAAISSNEGMIAQSTTNPFAIESKPHGHGDVHSLLHSSGIADGWVKGGFEHVVFFQDTNGLAFHSLCAALGVSNKLGLVMNSLTIPRKAKQAIGAICKLTNENGEEQTRNVEYNLLDPLLRATASPDGDVNDENTGFSVYPGNTNQLILELKTYVQTLKATSGVLSEFVNPKYADPSKTAFKAPTRLECMMQDFPMALSGENAKRVGFTSFDTEFLFSPIKNGVAEGAVAEKNGTAPAVASSAESDQYSALALIMRDAGCSISIGSQKSWSGITVSTGPKVVISPYIAPTPFDYKALFPNASRVNISGRSCLLIKGKGDLVIESLTLDGSLVIDTGDKGSIMVVSGIVVSNKGWEDVAITGDESEVLKMRGYNLEKHETLTLTASNDGKGGYSKVADYELSVEVTAATVSEEKVEIVESVVAPASVDAPVAAPAPSTITPAPVRAPAPTRGPEPAAKVDAQSVGKGASNDCGCSIS